MIILENDDLKVKIAEKGAELQMVYNKAHQLNYLWNADAKFWGKYSPILFPIVGTLKENTFTYNGKSYTLPRHGFARDMVFEKIGQTPHSATFELQSSAATMAVFPFEFSLQITYELNQDKLSVSYKVTNPSELSSMYFSIGAHPAFRVPIYSIESYEDYYLEFKPTLNNQAHLLADGLLMHETKLIDMQDNILNLSPTLFEKDALVFKNTNIDSISLRSPKHSHGLTMDIQGWADLGLWAAPNAPFLCIEPWGGHADFVNHNQDITTKEGILHLEALQSITKAWHLTCF